MGFFARSVSRPRCLTSLSRAGGQVSSGNNLGRGSPGERRPVTTQEPQSPPARCSSFHSSGPSSRGGMGRAGSPQKPRPRLPVPELPRPDSPGYPPCDRSGRGWGRWLGEINLEEWQVQERKKSSILVIMKVRKVYICRYRIKKMRQF